MNTRKDRKTTMTVQECYVEMEGDYDEVLSRLGKPERIEKYLKLFLSDECYQNLCDAMKVKDYRKSFEHVHNLKGVTLNLGLSYLFIKTDILCEALRGGEPKGDVEAMLADVTEAYEKTVNAIKKL